MAFVSCFCWTKSSTSWYTTTFSWIHQCCIRIPQLITTHDLCKTMWITYSPIFPNSFWTVLLGGVKPHPHSFGGVLCKTYYTFSAHVFLMGQVLLFILHMACSLGSGSQGFSGFSATSPMMDLGWFLPGILLGVVVMDGVRKTTQNLKSHNLKAMLAMLI